MWLFITKGSLVKVHRLMRWLFRSSLQKPINMGEVKPAPSRSDGDLCPVEALAALQVLQPHRWRRSADEAPLFRYESGAGLDREGITHFIRIAALAAGFPSELAGSHSLRKGGQPLFLQAPEILRGLRGMEVGLQMRFTHIFMRTTRRKKGFLREC
jgi:hypothetical protein